MRILVHDYSGHPFQVELSTALAASHEVTHSWCEAYVSGKGNLEAPGSPVRFESIGRGEVIEKLRFGRRLLQELRFGVQLVRQLRRQRPDVALIGNAPIPMMVVVASYLSLTRTPWVLWQQDIQGVAISTFAGAKLNRAFALVALLIGAGERWVARRATRVVVIAEAFLAIHRRWGTADKVSVIPNWAPLEEIVPVPRSNPWARSHGLEDQPTVLYSGTLGLKHNPRLLVELTRAVRDRGVDARLVVVTEGIASRGLQGAAEELSVPLTLLPFQAYADLPDVLGSGDVLVVLLEATAGAFSVPSKALSYLSAGRPVLGLMPDANAAAVLIARAGGMVLPPTTASLDEAGRWVADLLGEPQRRDELGHRARSLAEDEFALDGVSQRFDALLRDAARGAPALTGSIGG